MRLFLFGAATLAALALASPATAAAQAPGATLREAAPGAAPVELGIAADFVGVKWRGALEDAAIRFRRGGAWGAWEALHAGDVAPREGGLASALMPAGGATAYQVRAPEGARAVRAVAIDAQGSAAAGEPASAAGCYRDRAAWGADESLRFHPDGTGIWPSAYFPVQRLTVHHTATEPGGPDPAAVVQAIYGHHAQFLGWGDIGYQLLVDQQGCVYEGRHSGDDARPVYAGRHGHDGRLLAVNGAHAVGFNAGNVGVALLGDFTSAEPSRVSRRALVRALAGLARTSSLDPLASGLYVNPITGTTRVTPVISGHRDWLATECPGEHLYAALPAIRIGVAAALGRPPGLPPSRR